MHLGEDVKGQREARYLLLVGAVPVDAVPLRRQQPGAAADDQSRNPNQVHGGSEQTRRAEENETAQTRAQRKKERKEKD